MGIQHLAVLQRNNFDSPEAAAEVRLAENRANVLFESFLVGSGLKLEARKQAENDQRSRARPAHCKLIVALVPHNIRAWRPFGRGHGACIAPIVGLKSLRYAASVRMANRLARAATGQTHADYGRGKCHARLIL